MTLSSYPGATPSGPPGRGGPYGVYIPAYLDQAAVPHFAVLPDGTEVAIEPPAETVEMGDGHASDGLGADGAPLDAYVPPSGPVRRRPLGDVLGARSGDKGGTANIGLWAGDEEAYRWMLATLTVDEVRRLLPEGLADRALRAAAPARGELRHRRTPRQGRRPRLPLGPAGQGPGRVAALPTRRHPRLPHRPRAHHRRCRIGRAWTRPLTRAARL